MCRTRDVDLDDGDSSSSRVAVQRRGVGARRLDPDPVENRFSQPRRITAPGRSATTVMGNGRAHHIQNPIKTPKNDDRRIQAQQPSSGSGGDYIESSSNLRPFCGEQSRVLCWAGWTLWDVKEDNR